MRKTSLIFLLIVEIAALFLVYNLNHLFVQLGTAEIKSIKDQARQIATMASLNPETALSSLQRVSLFQEAKYSQQGPSEEALIDTDPPQFILRQLLTDGRIIKLAVPLSSTTLSAIRQIQSVSTGMIFMGALLALATAILLLVQFRNTKVQTQASLPIHPLQNYLVDLKGKEQRMQQEVALQRQEVEQKHRLTSLILSQIHFVVITLGKAQRIETFNKEAERIFNKSYASVVNHPIDTVLHDLPEELLRFIQDPTRRGHSIDLIYLGQTLHATTEKLPHDGLLITIEDITTEQTNRQLEMEKKSILQLGEMATFLSHEVRNSLGVIFGYTKTLKEDSNKIDKINKEIHFLTMMMDRFLGFSKPTQNPEQSICHLSKIMTDICTAHSIEVDQKGLEQAEAIADSNLLWTVLDNLVRNAIEAGSTHLTCEYRQDNRYTQMELTDNGQGIPSNLQQKIWLPFFTTKEKGNGMGLAMVRKLLIAMGGEITLTDSQPHQTRFIIRLPKSQV